MKTLGFDQPLYILPFDHRGSFQTAMFGWKGTLTAEQTAAIAATKQVIYEGFKAAVGGGVAKEKAGILVDEQFGAAILRDAAAQGYLTSCPAEKSGQDEFDFEYGEEFAKHIEAFQPTFCKVLVCYNPKSDQTLNRRCRTYGGDHIRGVVWSRAIGKSARLATTMNVDHCFCMISFEQWLLEYQ